MARRALLLRLMFVLLGCALLNGAAWGQDNGAKAQNPEADAKVADEGQSVTLPPNTVISVRIADDISSNHNHEGDLFTGIVDPSVLVHDRVMIPRGTEAHVRMAYRKKGGHVKGKAEVQLELVSLVVNGTRLGVATDVEMKDKGAMKAKADAELQSAQHMGSATGLAGPAGAAAGPVIGVFTAAKVEIKPNTRVEFTLAKPFTFDKPPVTGTEQTQ